MGTSDSSKTPRASTFNPGFGRAKENTFALSLDLVVGFVRAEGNNPRTGKPWGYGSIQLGGKTVWVGDGNGSYGVQVQLPDHAALDAFVAAHPGCTKAEGTGKNNPKPRVVTTSRSTFKAACAVAGVTVTFKDEVETAPEQTAPAAVAAPAIDPALWAEFQAFLAFKAKA